MGQSLWVVGYAGRTFASQRA